MIFTPEHLDKIRSGLKTQTRRVKKPNEELVYDGGTPAVMINGRRKYIVGRDYKGKPGRTSKGTLTYRILDIREERLRDIDNEEAVLEGVPQDWHHDPLVTPADLINEPFLHRPRQRFARLWMSINHTPGTRWEDNPVVFVYTIEYVKDK